MPHDSFPEIDGRSSAVEALKTNMRLAARDPFVTVLIHGESGTGKERVAQAIHRASPRHGAPFVIVNCAGLSSTLIEDELFGHMRGAFTGAINDRPGPFERASGGTVFLDEVGELPSELQTKLLRALQQRTVQRLGCGYETAFDVRVIAATNLDLASAVARHRFREDLYYRLNVYPLRVPALRTRGAADVRQLVDAILARLTDRRQRPAAALDPRVLELFSQYAWPGNVRELENTLERMVVAAAEDSLLTTAHLPDGFGSVSRKSQGSLGGHSALRPSLEDIRAALAQNAFRQERAATQLGLSRHQFYRLLKKTRSPSTAAAAATDT